jgi:hypothetical protein
MTNTTNIRTRINVSRRNDCLGRPVDGEWLVTVSTGSTCKGVGSALKAEMVQWAKWFRSQGAASVRLTTKRAMYTYPQFGRSDQPLGTHWTMRVTV